MSGKNILIIFLVSVFSLTLNAEIIKFSRLNKKKSNFSIKRDIFSAERSIRTNQAGIKRMIQPPKIEEIKKAEEKVENELRQSVFYEGYIIKNTKSHALLSVNGEFYIVCEQESINDKIKVIKIEKKRVILEIDSASYEIKLKGDDDE